MHRLVVFPLANVRYVYYVRYTTFARPVLKNFHDPPPIPRQTTNKKKNKQNYLANKQKNANKSNLSSSFLPEDLRPLLTISAPAGDHISALPKRSCASVRSRIDSIQRHVGHKRSSISRCKWKQNFASGKHQPPFISSFTTLNLFPKKYFNILDAAIMKQRQQHIK